MRYVRQAAPPAALPLRELAERGVWRVWVSVLALLFDDLEVKKGRPTRPKLFREAVGWFVAFPDCAAALCAMYGIQVVTLYEAVESHMQEAGIVGPTRITFMLARLRR